MTFKPSKYLELFVHSLELSVVIGILFLTLALQFLLHELPCPLCLLQRIGFLGIALGFLMNLRFGFRPSHYSIVLLSSLFTAAVALRQIALHAIPGTGSYGSPILGLHLYTWSFILAVTLLVITSLILGIDKQFLSSKRTNKAWHFLTHILFGLVTLVILINIISAFLECGFRECPDNPTNYELLRVSKSH